MPSRKRLRPTLSYEEPKRTSTRTNEPTRHRLDKNQGCKALARVLQATPVLPEDSTQTPPMLDTKPQSFTLGIDMERRLAILAHSMLLIAYLERAQQGVLLPQKNDTTSDGANSTISLAPKTYPSIIVSRRWLEAVTAYCQTTVSMDDVARVAAAFPNWVRVCWDVQEGPWARSGIIRNNHTNSPSVRPLSENSNSEKLSFMASTPAIAWLDNPEEPMPNVEELTARFYILVFHVPSIEEATTELNRSFKTNRAVNIDEQAFDDVVRRRALDAYKEQQLRARAGNPNSDAYGCISYLGSKFGHRKTNLVPTITPKDESAIRTTLPSSFSHTPSKSLTSGLTDTNPDENIETDAALLDMLSLELRASLTAAKLKEVLRCMKEEASNVRSKKLAEIEKRQEEERLLSTYAHVRSLFGRDKKELNMAQLLRHLESESLFEDHRRIRPQLSLLLSRTEFGLIALRLTPDSDSAGRGTTSKDSTSWLKRVHNLDTVTNEELESTLVQLDRSKAFVKLS